jgi:two-component system LytT family response regulator
MTVQANHVTLTTFIAEDEELARAKLRAALESRREIALVGEAADGGAALRAIEQLKPRLLLLDVQMPVLDGFEVVRRLTYAPQVIFTTAYDQYAIRAFEVRSIDYLLKPYPKERLYEALDRALEQERLGRAAQTDVRLQRLLRELQGPPQLACKRRGDIYLVKPQDVIWIESADTITFVHTQTEKLQIGRTLDELEHELAGAGFFRARRAALVNLNYVRKLTPMFNGNYEMTLEHADHPISVSRRRGRELQEKFGW